MTKVTLLKSGFLNREKMDKNKIKLIQELLVSSGHKLKVDGDFGPLTKSAVMEYYEFPEDWNSKRVAIGFIQVVCLRNDIAVGRIDGLWGQKTQAGYEKLLAVLGKPIPKPAPTKTIDVNRGYKYWPRGSYGELVNFYGPVGKNQGSMSLPYGMVLAWDQSKKVNRVTCHEKVVEPFQKVLQLTKEHYGISAIRDLGLDQFGGMFNVRKMRGGSSWSHHSWGVVMDIDPDRNRLRWGRDKAFLARPEYDAFWKIVYSEGMRGLGPEKNYDWMHFGCVNY